MQVTKQFQRQISPVFLLSSLLLLLGASAAWYVQNLYRDLAEVLELNVASVRAAEELEIGLREIRTRLNESLYRNVPISTAELKPLREATDRWLSETVRLATTEREQEMISRLKAGYEHFFERLDIRNQSQTQELIDAILTREIIGPAHEYLDYNEATMIAVAHEHRVFSSRISLALLAIGVCGSIGGFFGGMHSARTMRRTLVELNLPLSLAAGKLSEVVGPIRLSTSLDLDELKHVIEALAVEVDRVVARLQKSQQEILHSEKLAAIGQLAAGTAHEIRNPLMSIKLLVQATLANPTAAPLTESDLRLIEQEISRLERTVQNLLDFARPPELAPERVSLRRIVQRSVALVSGRATIQRIRISERLASDDEVVGDRQQLQQVILNLLINSLDAATSGGEVVVASERAGDAIKVAVMDDGQGIPETLLPNIFEPFTSSKASGTGLGLSISKRIVEAHGGEMFAANRDKTGAVVGFTLPVSGAGGDTHAAT